MNPARSGAQPVPGILSANHARAVLKVLAMRRRQAMAVPSRHLRRSTFTTVESYDDEVKKTSSESARDWELMSEGAGR